MRLILLPATLVFSASAAIAENPPRAPVAGSQIFVIPVVDPGCTKAKPGDDVIVVCGREDRRYRIDPTIMAASRARDALERPPRGDGHKRLFQESGCSPVGGFGCAGQNVLPVSSVALTVATALIKVVKGEDLRPMLRQGPTDYDLYKSEKAIEDAKAAPE